jgi:uncharacterized protein YkwD
MSYFRVAGRSVRLLAASVLTVALIASTALTPVHAIEVNVTDRIAQAKIKIWGEYPKAEQAFPEVARPAQQAIASVEAASAKAVTKTQSTPPKSEAANNSAQPNAKVERQETKPVAQAAPAIQAENKQEAKAAHEEQSAPSPEPQPEPQPAVEAASAPVSAPAVTEAPVAIAATGDTWIDEILRLTNEARVGEGLSPLSLNSTLNQAAAIRVPELPNSPSPHVRPNGDAFYTVFAEVGLKPRSGGENYAIATANAFTPEKIVTAWLNSPGHRKNIMNTKYTQIGIGHGVIGEKQYFEQLFIG